MESSSSSSESPSIDEPGRTVQKPTGELDDLLVMSPSLEEDDDSDDENKNYDDDDGPVGWDLSTMNSYTENHTNDTSIME